MLNKGKLLNILTLNEKCLSSGRSNHKPLCVPLL